MKAEPIIIRNDTNDDVSFIFGEEEIELSPKKTATIYNNEFDKLKLENFVVKIKNGVIKIKDVL